MHKFPHSLHGSYLICAIVNYSRFARLEELVRTYVGGNVLFVWYLVLYERRFCEIKKISFYPYPGFVSALSNI